MRALLSTLENKHEPFVVPWLLQFAIRLPQQGPSAAGNWVQVSVGRQARADCRAMPDFFFTLRYPHCQTQIGNHGDQQNYAAAAMQPMYLPPRSCTPLPRLLMNEKPLTSVNHVSVFKPCAVFIPSKHPRGIFFPTPVQFRPIYISFTLADIAAARKRYFSHACKIF